MEYFEIESDILNKVKFAEHLQKSKVVLSINLIILD